METGAGPKRPFDPSVVIVTVVAAALGVVWGSVFVHHGLRFSGDSGLFLDLAVGLRSGWFEIPATRAPLYPMAWTAFTLLEPYGADAASWLSAASLIAVLWGLARISLDLTRDTVSSALMAVVAACWAGLLFVFEVAWTEHLYMALLVLHLWFVLRHVREERTVDLVLAAVLAGAAMLTRYLGLSLMGSFVVYVVYWMFRTGRRSGRAALVPAGAVFGASLPLLLHLLRNRSREGTLTGERPESVLSALHNAGVVVSELLAATDQLVLVPLMAVAGLVALAALWRSRNRPEEADAPVLGLGAYMALHATMYVGLLVYAASTVAFDAISNRFVSPLFPMVLLLVPLGVAAVQRMERWPTWAPWGVRIGLLIGAASGLPGIAADLDRMQERRGTVAYHNTDGYAHSASATALGRAVGAALSADLQDTTISVLSHPTSRVSNGLFLRRATWRDSGLDVRGFHDFGDREYKVDVRAGGREATLHYISATPVPNKGKLAARLEQVLEAAGTDRMLLVVADAAVRDLKLPKDDWTQVLGKQLEVTPAGGERPYAVVWVRRTGTPAPAAVAVAEGSDPAEAAPEAAAPAVTAPPKAPVARVAGTPSSAPPPPVPAPVKPGKWGIGQGWGTLPGRADERFRYANGVHEIDANGPDGRKVQMLCSGVAPVRTGATVQVAGAMKATGLTLGDDPHDVGARVLMVFISADKKFVFDKGVHPRHTTVVRATSDQPWTEFNLEVPVYPEAVSARLCLEVAGTAGVGAFKEIRWVAR